MKRSAPLLLLVGAIVLVSVGCGMKPKKHYGAMRSKLLARDFDGAAAYIEKSKGKVYKKKDRLLYYMDKGAVLNLAGKYNDSNTMMEQAKVTAEELWTESVSTNVAAWMTTDNTLPYQGEDFEKVLIHFVAALNYLAMGDQSAARVEARQMTDKLELYNSKYPEHKNAYTDDAFARWLAGKLRETEGGRSAWNEAWIDYQRAIEVYEGEYARRYHTSLPKIVIQDAMRVLDALGSEFSPELSQLQSKYPAVTFQRQADLEGKGQVVFIHMAGEAPIKKDKFWNVYDNDAVYIEARTKRGEARVVVAGKRRLVFRVAYPEYTVTRARIRGARITVGGASASTELMEPITAIAVQNLKDHMARIKTKAIFRAATKYLAAKAAQAGGKALSKKKGKAGAAGLALQLAGAAYQVGSVIAEEADKRTWTTLPAEIGVARVWAPAGQQQIQVSLQGGQSFSLPVNVQPGKTTFVAYRTFR